MKDLIQEYMDELHLNTVLGCSLKTYRTNGTISDANSLYKLYLDEVLPSVSTYKIILFICTIVITNTKKPKRLLSLQIPLSQILLFVIQLVYDMIYIKEK